MSRKTPFFATVVVALLCTASAWAKDNAHSPAKHKHKATPAATKPAKANAAPAKATPASATEPPQPGPLPGDSSSVDDTSVSAHADVSSGAYKPFVIAPHIGVLIPELFSKLGSWPVFGLQFGYILPFNAGAMRHPVELNFDFAFTNPGSTGTGKDPNLGDGGGTYNWTLQQRTFTMELTGMWRFKPAGQFISPYALIGPRIYLMQTVLDATGNGKTFGQNTETDTEVGLVLGGGTDIKLGPGSIFGTLKFSWSNLKQRITGNSNTGAFTLDVGYRFYL